MIALLTFVFYIKTNFMGIKEVIHLITNENFNQWFCPLERCCIAVKKRVFNPSAFVCLHIFSSNFHFKSLDNWLSLKAIWNEKYFLLFLKHSKHSNLYKYE